MMVQMVLPELPDQQAHKVRKEFIDLQFTEVLIMELQLQILQQVVLFLLEF